MKGQKFLPTLDSSGNEPWYELWFYVMIFKEVCAKKMLLTQGNN